MPAMTFKAKVEAIGPAGSWSRLVVPFEVEKVFASKARVSVKGTINGFPYRSSIFPQGDGTHSMMVNKAMQAGGGFAPGDTVTVVMEADTAPRTVAVPADLKKALGKAPRAKAFFEKLAYSGKKSYVDFFEDAKKRETRAKHIVQTVALLKKGQRSKE